jgi:asparagine synthase (glutamine-hydrolysing)
MCGIFAVFHRYPPTCLNQIWKAHGILRKRGPDSSSIVLNKHEFLAFKRLAIVDTSTAGNQPFFSDDRQIAVMCNGEIYNYKQLIKEYDLQCYSGSDCEVILRLYEKYGFANTVSKLDGVFAIVLRDYSQPQKKVWIARDHIGIRPLFQGTTVDGSPAFASVAAALLPFCIPHTVQQVPAKRYGFLDLSTGTLNYMYLDLPLYGQETYSSLRGLLYNAVEKRLQGSEARPIGCLLSGGLDSSVIASILKRLHPNVRTYSIGMSEDGETSPSVDCRYARDVAFYLGGLENHTEVKFTPLQGFEAIPEVIQALESYDITTVRASVPMYLLAKYIKANSKDTIIFSGEGSDELFGGYLYFKKAPSLSAFLLESKTLIKELPYFDVLRADRCISAHGLELRVPFLDIYVAEFASNMRETKWPFNGIEKYHLRTSFQGDLPEHVLWRRKDGLSDGVSGAKTWATYIGEFVDNIVSDETFQSCNGLYPSKEALYYHQVYKRYFPGLSTNMPHYWMPKWMGDVKDPSGRLVEECKDWTEK